MTHVCIFGDSITLGCWDPEGGWVQRIRKLVDERNMSEEAYSCYLYNLGISGDTSTGIIERFDREVRLRISEEPQDETVILISVGVNDSAYLIDRGRSQLLLEEFNENLLVIVDKARKYTSTIGFAGLLPVDQKRVDPIPWAPELAYRNEIVEEFDAQIRNVCLLQELYFVDLWNDWRERDVSQLLTDGVHPNAEGHKAVAERVIEFFRVCDLL